MLLFDILLIAGAALGFATLDLLRKLLSEKLSLVPLLFWLTAGVIPLYLLWWIGTGAQFPNQGYWLAGMGSVALNVLANLLYLRAIHLGEFSRTIPLLSLTPVLTTFFAVPLLGELPTAEQGLGIGLVVAGALLLQISPSTESSEGHEGVAKTVDESRAREGRRSWRLRLPPSAWLMLAVACLWAATTPLDKLALRSATVPFHALNLHVGIAAAMFTWLVVRRETAGILAKRSTWWLLAAAVVVSAIALGCQLLALERILAALLETLKRGFGGIAALTFGYLWFKERITLAKFAAVAIMVLGVGLLMF